MPDGTTTPIPKGNEAREAIDALRGYVYQIYQSALAWIELQPEEILFLEVAEDYAVIVADALNAVQVKETGHNVTINSGDVVASIDSFVVLRLKNPELQVRLRHLTTSRIGKEKSAEYRIGDAPTLETWRKLAKTGDLAPLRKILDASKLSKQTKDYIRELGDTAFREEFLKRIHFDCGALDSKFLARLLRSKLSKLVIERGGVDSQADSCLDSLFMTLLHKATQKEERFVDRNILEKLVENATHIPVNRALFESQGQLLIKALSASTPQATNLITARLAEPSPIDEVPLPAAIASRTLQIDSIVSSLTQYSVSWIFGAAGVGKTIGARISARRLGGHWAGINLRGLDAEQVNALLSDAIDRLMEQKVDGFLVDDLECPFEPHIIDALLYLRAICDRTDRLLLFTSPRLPDSGFLSSANLPTSIGQKLEEFSEQDIREILTGLGVDPTNWAKYIHLVSGGGHPQLAIAIIQSMQNSGWDISEIRMLKSLLGGNTALEQVRARTRERLLNELPEGARRLLERLSLKVGGFRRGFVLDMAQITPTVPDGGIVLDRLIGPWVDQQERDRFALSPLLSNLAANTLTDEQKRKINFEIATSLVKGRKLDPIEANSALIAALSGKNDWAIIFLCSGVFMADQNVLKMIAPHLMMFTLMRTDAFAYEDNPVVSQMFRGAQLVLICHEEERKEKVQEILECFEAESNRVEHEVMDASMALPVYAKLLFTEPKFGALPRFWDLVRKLDELLENQEKNLPPELLGEIPEQEFNGIWVVGFLFLNQARQIRLIDELLPVFEFLDSCEEKRRRKLLDPYANSGPYQRDLADTMDMLVSGAWLSEHKANTIDPLRHSAVYARLEEFAQSWNHADLAVCCRRYRAVILDGYGGDKDQALAILDEGLERYGETNSVLVKAKAMVLYRADDYQGSLNLSKRLIEGNAPLNEVDKAFLGRDAAVSAEKQGDYETARRYYLYASNAAGNCRSPDMAPMRVGLMADAALASWHTGDRETCLRDFVVVLQELKEFDPKSFLRAAHCHAVCRHVLLWLYQDASGEKRLLTNGKGAEIVPGIVSNPEPHSEIRDQYIIPIEMAWYMLAAVENHCCLDVGITQNLENFLPKGAVFEGQLSLTRAKMRKAFALLDTALFVTALRETVAIMAYVNEQGLENSFDIENVTYGLVPLPTLEQQADLSKLAEQFVLCFASNCIFAESVAALAPVMDTIEKGQGFQVREEFSSCLQGRGSGTDYNSSLAALLAIHRRAIDTKEVLPPGRVFELAFQALHIAKQTGNTHVMAKPVFEWLSVKWSFALEHQRFLLKNPSFHEDSIAQVRTAEGSSWTDKVIDLLQAMLPAIGFSNGSEPIRILNDIRSAASM